MWPPNFPATPAVAAPTSLFAGRVAVLITRHGKDLALAPVLRRTLGLYVLAYVPDALGVDAPSAPVSRAGLLDAARAKARVALDRVPGASLVVAAAGTVAPHPIRPDAACDRELVLLTERPRRGPLREFVGEAIGATTAVRRAAIRSVDEALAAAAAFDLPGHALLVRAGASRNGSLPGAVVASGLVDPDALVAAVGLALAVSPTAHLAVDRRASLNPTRARVLASAGAALSASALRACPVCGCPGFAADGGTDPGLGASACVACGHRARRPSADAGRAGLDA